MTKPVPPSEYLADLRELAAHQGDLPAILATAQRLVAKNPRFPLVAFGAFVDVLSRFEDASVERWLDIAPDNPPTRVIVTAVRLIRQEATAALPLVWALFRALTPEESLDVMIVLATLFATPPFSTAAADTDAAEADEQFEEALKEIEIGRQIDALGIEVPDAS